MENHRDGGKIGGDHTTLSDLAAILVDIAVNLPEVSRISPGYLKNSVGGGRSARSVKLSDCQGGLLLTVRQNGSVQEVRVFTKNPQNTKLVLARKSRDMDVAIKFGGG